MDSTRCCRTVQGGQTEHRVLTSALAPGLVLPQAQAESLSIVRTAPATPGACRQVGESEFALHGQLREGQALCTRHVYSWIPRVPAKDSLDCCGGRHCRHCPRPFTLAPQVLARAVHRRKARLSRTWSTRTVFSWRSSWRYSPRLRPSRYAFSGPSWLKLGDDVDGCSSVSPDNKRGVGNRFAGMLQ